MARHRIPLAVRAAVAERAHHRCEYCQIRDDYSTAAFEMEHVFPSARGGGDTLDDLAYSCRGCNGAKGVMTEALDPLTNQSAPLFHPRRDRWGAHFEWSPDFTKVLGRTPTGRATVIALEMNRLSLMNLRRVLRLIGLHPPVGEP